MDNDQILLFARYVDRVLWGEEQVRLFAEAIARTGMTLREIADKAGVAHSYVKKLKSSPCKAEMRTLAKVLAAMGVDLYAVFDAPAISILRVTP